MEKVELKVYKMTPSYLDLSEKKFKERIERAYKLLENCRVCSRTCGANRLKGEKGKCNAGLKLKISSYFPHFGEERPLVGKNGSGTIFLSNCNLKCVFCQNYEISQLGLGEEVSTEKCSEMMLSLQKRGCHNINWVSPSHFVPQLMKALFLARERGLRVPIVYNTGGYDNIETLRLLEGIVDIYMPDIKYSSNEIALKYSGISNYWDVVRNNVKEMYKQVGDLKVNKEGIAERGLLIRHLVLPNNLAGSEKVLDFVAKEISKNSYINIMNQYYPSNLAYKYKELNKTIALEEFEMVVRKARALGLKRGFENEF